MPNGETRGSAIDPDSRGMNGKRYCTIHSRQLLEGTPLWGHRAAGRAPRIYDLRNPRGETAR